MRAAEPVEQGQVHLKGFGVGYEVFGPADAPAVLLLPAWQIVHSRVWKMQVPFLSRFFRVITIDPPGNGLGERTVDPAAFEYDRIVDQAVGLLDHLGIQQTHVIGFSRGCDYGIALAARYPERVDHLILIANGVAHDWQPGQRPAFWERRDSYEGWEKYNAHYWREHYQDWLEFFFTSLYPEPHSTKGIDDGVRWGLDTTPDILAQTVPNLALHPAMPADVAIAQVRCPVMLIHGDQDQRDPIEITLELARMRPDWSLVVLEGCGHVPIARDPVRVNLIIREFLNGSPDARQGVIANASV
jgi:pimeloyl-ACP methyl ester carboxylesterase